MNARLETTSEKMDLVAPRPPANSPRPIRILVVDDEQDARQLTSDVLANAGYAVAAVKDGAAGWAALQAGQYDLIVTDNKMPRMLGVEMIEKLRTARMALPVVMVTGYLPTHEYVRRPWLKPDVILEKPFSNADLLAAVKKLLPREQGSDVCPQAGSLEKGLKMKRATPQMRQLAHCLIAHERSGDKSSGAKASVTFFVVEKLRPHLASLMGAGGFRALLARALTLATAEIPWLRMVHVKADGALAGVEQVAAQLAPKELLEGRVVLLAQLLGLLEAFIGEELTVRLVREVWPKVSLKSLNIETKGKYEKTH